MMNTCSDRKPRITLRFILLALLALIWIFPIVISICISFKTPGDFMTSRFFQLPVENGLLKNLNTAITTFSLFRQYGNSLIYAVGGTLLCILVSATAAYGCAIIRPKYSFLIFIIIYSGTVFPFQMYLLPLYRLYVATKLYNTHFGMILFYGTICTPFATFTYRSHFMGMSHEIRESAVIDGCSAWNMFPYIYLPLLKVPTAVVIVFQAIWIWNDLLFGMVLSQSPNVRPVMVSIFQIAGEGGGNLVVLMAAVLITSIPTLALFIGLRNYFIQGTLVGIRVK
jgi:multiple sugar transport system permease protein